MHLIGFIIKKFVTMHGQTNVKFVFLVSHGSVPGIFTMSSAGVRLSSFVFFSLCIYPLINHILHFLSFFPSPTLPMSMFSLVSLRHLSKLFAPETSILKAALITSLPPSRQSTCINLLAETTPFITYHRPHSSLYEPRTTAIGCLFGFLTLEEGTDM